jgi:hypothetical protein
MPITYFQVRLSVQSKGEGKAELVPPSILEGLDYIFITVKDGGEEGIVKLEEAEAVLKKIEADKDCHKLTVKRLTALQKTYPPPKLKKQYRRRPQGQEAGEVMAMGGLFAVDDQGNRIIDTFQTVRSGFYLIDVPVSPGPSR